MTAPSLVSVVIAVHDDERHLADAIRSARAQEHPGVEIIVVDDASPVDVTMSARAAGADRAVRLERQHGPSYARNVGIALAQGPLIAILDSDDRMLPGRLSEQSGLLERRRDVAGVFGDHRVVIEPGVEPPQWHDPRVRDGDIGGAALGSLMVRRSALLEHGGYDPSRVIGEDSELLMRMERAGAHIERIDRPLIERTLHGRNLTQVAEQALRNHTLGALRSVHGPRSTPDVSVVVPAFNAERYLAEAVASALEQRGAQLEVIVVDDGSDDATVQVARAIADEDERVRAFSTAHAGTGAARNLGLLLARGRLVAFLDADDVWPTGRIAAQLHAFESNPAPEIVLGGVEEFVSPDCTLPIRPRARAVGNVPSAALVSRAAIARVGPFAIDPSAPEWLQWYARAVALGVRPAAVPQTVLRRRLHASNHSAVNRTANTHFLDIVRESLRERRAGTEGEMPASGEQTAGHG